MSSLPQVIEPGLSLGCACAIDRRRFLKQALTLGISGVLGGVPIGAGLTVLLTPLKHQSGRGQAVFISTLDALPTDRTPRKFPVVAVRIDAWNRSEGPIGAVYLRRLEHGVHALNVVCPHAGCFVDYSTERAGYYCPCHHSSFGLDGAIQDPRSPAPRGLDELEVEIRRQNQVWVKFLNFRSGEPRKIVV
ncbi:MAG: Rieske 2Fe-2S domain-containing protein [Verrucomicrobia bacterium]|nr:Rieske 2Fe-2S domain-containing protein [Verrucomicrobiota bacterium]